MDPVLRIYQGVSFRSKAVSRVKSHTSQGRPHTAAAYPCFCSMKQLRVFLLRPGWDASPLQGYSQQYVAGIHLYTWVERDCEVKFLV